jgi:hypothetical protein
MLGFPENAATSFFVSRHFTHPAAALTFQINPPVSRTGSEEGAVQRQFWDRFKADQVVTRAGLPQSGRE